jgi:hypothetical protein
MVRIRYLCAAECTDKEAYDTHLTNGIVLRAEGKLRDASLEFGLAVRPASTLF